MKILTVRTSSYEKDGVVKYNYMTIWKFIEGKNWPFITLDVQLPVKGWGRKWINEDWIVNIFDTENKDWWTTWKSTWWSAEDEMWF